MRIDDLDLHNQPVDDTGEIRTARGQLAAFLSSLTPKFRRMLLGIDLTGWEAIEDDLLTDSERQDFDRTLGKYHKLFRTVVNSWNRGQGTRQELVLSDFTQLHFSRLSLTDVEKQWRRGAPKKRLENRRDVKRAVQAQALAERLAEGMRLKRARKSKGGYESGDERILPELLRRYTAEEAAAILAAPTLLDAVKRLLLPSSGISARTLDTSIRRGRQLLQQHLDQGLQQ